MPGERISKTNVRVKATINERQLIWLMQQWGLTSTSEVLKRCFTDAYVNERIKDVV